MIKCVKCGAVYGKQPERCFYCDTVEFEEVENKEFEEEQLKKYVKEEEKAEEVKEEEEKPKKKGRKKKKADE